MTTADRFELEAKYLPLARALEAVLRERRGLRRGHQIVIGISGESGCGKSVTATCLAHVLDAGGHVTRIIHQDDYFIRPPRTNHEYRQHHLTSVGPQEVRLDLIATHLRAFRGRQALVETPLVDYDANCIRSQERDFSDSDVLIIEGTYALLLEDLDVRIFLEATHEDSRARRRERNRDLDAPILSDILAIEHRLIAPLASRAHVLISREFEPRLAS